MTYSRYGLAEVSRVLPTRKRRQAKESCTNKAKSGCLPSLKSTRQVEALPQPVLPPTSQYHI